MTVHTSSVLVRTTLSKNQIYDTRSVELQKRYYFELTKSGISRKRNVTLFSLP